MIVLDVCYRLRLAEWPAPSSPIPWYFSRASPRPTKEVKHLALVCGDGIANPQGVALGCRSQQPG